MKIRKKIRLDDTLIWTGARMFSGNRESWIDSISTDSRTLEKGDLFIPVAGENFDGHDFIDAAVRSGAGGLVYEKKKKAKVPMPPAYAGTGKTRDFMVLETDDSKDFLMKLARGYIRQFDVVTIGITGSLGKTTARSLVTSVLKRGFDVVQTPKNFNTEIGVSKTIFNIGSSTDFFVAELGMRGKGQIGPLADASNVKIGAITSISGSHMEFFDSIESLAAAKAEIAGPVRANRGQLFLNADDDMTPFIKGLAGADIIEFGSNSGRDYNFIEKDSDNLGRFSFDLYKKRERLAHIKCSHPGYHNMYNTCLAAAVCHLAGAGIDMIKKGLENSDMEAHRMKVLECGGLMVIDDCYNASPASVQGALDTLDLISKKRNGRTVAILGDMLELGDSAAELHSDVGKYASKKDIDVLVTSGKLAKNICRGFMENCRKSQKCMAYDDGEKLLKDLGNIIETGDIILVKGSRAAKMENIVQYLEKWP
jgi:UDP-N-acetylmuramoyl-tripeptide--D-alanyl-D-alanine ligase